MNSITSNQTRPTNPTGPSEHRRRAVRPIPPSVNAAYTADPPDPSVLDRPLPHRPRLLPGLPVLRRTTGELQLGLDQRHAVVLSGLPEVLGNLLHGLDGRHTEEELLARAGPAAQVLLRQILLGLVDIGLVEDAAATGPTTAGNLSRLSADRTSWSLRTGQPRTSVGRFRDPAAVLVYGSGRSAIAIATLLAAAGVGRVHTVADGVVQPEDTGCSYLDEDIGQPRSDAAARAVARAATEVRTSRLTPRQRADLVVVADLVVAEPALLTSLATSRQPHLSVHVTEGIGVVGPLVLPGRTGCLRCGYLRNTDSDGAWPALAAQLAGRPQPADLATVQAAAGFAVGQVLRYLHGPRDRHDELPVCGAAIEVDTFTGETRRVPCPPHPDCDCAVVARAPRPRTARAGLRDAALPAASIGSTGASRPTGPITSEGQPGQREQFELSGQPQSHREAVMRQRA